MIKKRDNNTPALDMMFMVALAFLLLIFMMIPFLNPITKDGVVDPPVLLLIEADWDVESDTDVDLYVKGPDGSVIYYANKDNGYITLKKDDLGSSSDEVIIDGVVVRIPRNYEVTTLTALPDGWYTVNVHLFTGKAETVNVKVTNIQDYGIVFEGEVTIVSRQEATLINFLVEDGKIIELDQEVEHKLRRFPSP